MVQLKTKLERDLFDLAEILGVGTKNSDICLRAIKKLQSLEGEISQYTTRYGDGSLSCNCRGGVR
jgi:hypothetical protein